MDLDGRRFSVQVQALASVPRGALGPVVGDLRDERDALFRALGILTHGF